MSMIFNQPFEDRVDLHLPLPEEEELETEKDVVPWYSPEQFLKVYEYLYSPELTKKRWAVDQISVWDTRCHPSLPTAVEASLVLCRAIIQDVLFVNGASLCQEKEIQMLYSMALVRFINLTIELHQTYQKRSSVIIAQCLGIPSWIVDLRNEATHAFSPSLPVLRMGANAAMKFLDENFWSVEATKQKNIVKEPVDCETIKNLLLRYQVLKFNVLYHKEKDDPAYLRNKKELRNILKKVSSCVTRNRNEFIEVLIMDGYFIPFDADLELMLKIKGCEMFIKKDEAGNEDNNGDCVVNYPLPKLPPLLEDFWYPILTILNNKNAIPYFVEALLYTQANRKKTGQMLIVLWVSRIIQLVLDVYKFKDSKKRSILSFLFQFKSPVFDWERLLFACVSKPCIYTPFVFPLIVAQMDVDEEFVRSLMNLLAISQGQALDQHYKLPKNRTTFTLERLKQTKTVQELKRKEDKKRRDDLKRKRDDQKRKKDTNIWSLAPDNIDFKNIPIGAVFNFSEEEDNMMMMENIFLIDVTKDVNNTVQLFWGNKNDEDMKDFSTVEQNTFMEDERIISKRRTFLYRK